MEQGGIKIAAIIGCGTVGRNWALTFLRAGWMVRVFDPDPVAERMLRRALAQLQEDVGAFQNVGPEALSFHEKLSDVVKGAVWIQESAPDRADLKRKIYQTVQVHSSPEALIASSSESLTTTDVQAFVNRKRLLLVVRPKAESFSSDQVIVFGGPASSRSLLVSISEFLIGLGLRPEIQLM